MKKLFKMKKFDFCFHRWANKPYAVFNSLHKIIKIGVVSVSYSLIALSSENVFAQTDTLHKGKIAVLDEASITAEKRRTLSETGRIITVISRSEIAASGANSLNDLLKSVPGFDVRSRGQNGVQADINIRGGSFDQSLLLLNGVNITDPQTGHYNADIPVNMNDIDRIEILEGSGARTQGPGAFSGAINIVTGENKQSSLTLQVDAGQNAFLAQSASAHLSRKKIMVHASASHAQSNGYMQATDFNINNFFLQSKLCVGGAGSFDIQAAWQDKAYGANSFYSPAYRNQFEYVHTGLLTAGWNKSFDKADIHVYAYVRRHYDRYELIRDSSYGRNFHRTDVPGAQAKFNYYMAQGKTSAGVGVREERIVSSNLGIDLNSPFDADYTGNITPTPQYIKGKNRTSLYYFIDQTFYFGNWSIAGGVQGHWNSDYNNNFTGGINAERRFAGKFKITTSVNSAMRLPTYTELYYKGAGYIPPTTTLAPEKAVTVEIGAQYRDAANLCLFHRRGRNILDWVKLQTDDPWESANITEMNTTGAELTATWRIKNFGWLDRVQLTGLWQTQDKHSDRYISKYVQDYLRFKITGIVEHRIVLPELTANWRLMLQNRAGTYNDFDDNNKPVPYPTLFLANVKINYALKQFAAFVVFENIFDTKYMDIGNLRQPGLWIKTGITARIN